MRPDELSEQIPGLTVPDEAAYETVGGYVMSELGRIPEVGDVVEAGGGTLSVTRMDGRRIDRICFRPHHEPGDGPAVDQPSLGTAAEHASANGAAGKSPSAHGQPRRSPATNGKSGNGKSGNGKSGNGNSRNGGRS
jgi:hypothetical protein